MGSGRKNEKARRFEEKVRAKRRAKADWGQGKKLFGAKRMLCPACGRVANVLTAVLMQANAMRVPVLCHDCNGPMRSV